MRTVRNYLRSVRHKPLRRQILQEDRAVFDQSSMFYPFYPAPLPLVFEDIAAVGPHDMVGITRMSVRRDFESEHSRNLVAGGALASPT